MKTDEMIGKKIMIRYCSAFGPEFEGLTPHSEHIIIDAPANQKPDNDNGRKGYWVMGKTEPVLVLWNEMKVAE